MTRPLVRWMRVVLPNSTFVALCIACEMLIEIVYLLVVWLDGQADEIFFRNVRCGFLGFCATCYGVSRVILFHPAFNEQYLDWLKATPWTFDKPLPGGPIWQVPQDLVVLSSLMFLTRDPSLHVLWLPVAYLIGYLTALATATRSCGDWPCAYLIGFGLGGVALAGRSPLASCLVAMACYPIALLGIQRTLKRLPWDIDWKRVTKYSQQNLEEMFRERLGWPHDFMSPKLPTVWIPYQDGICSSLLFGWIAFVALFHTDGNGRAAFCGFVANFLSIAILIRVGSYMRAHRWPINFWGRLWTFRWIIPRYDVIYVAPLLAEVILLTTQLVAGYLFVKNNPMWNAAPNPIQEWLALGCSSCGIASTFLVMLVMGPVLERWRLAGAHRIVFDQSGMGSKGSQSQFVEL